MAKRVTDIQTSSLSLQSNLTTKGASLMYIGGKLLRFGFFYWLLTRLSSQIQQVAGYSFNQLIIFFLIYNLLDMLGQMFFRGIYFFRDDVVTGRFDLMLIKPLNTLFQIMTKRTDFLDLPLLGLVIALLIFKSHPVDLITVIMLVLSLSPSFILILSAHIMVACIGVITTEVDHTIMIWRDLCSMARVPTDIYVTLIKIFLTIIVPITLAITFPAKVLLQALSWPLVILTLVISIFYYLACLKFWQYALKQYSSASS